MSTTNSVAHSWEVCGLVRLSRRLRPNRVRHVTRGTNEEWSRPDHGTTPQAPAALIFKDASAPVGFPIDHQASNTFNLPQSHPTPKEKFLETFLSTKIDGIKNGILLVCGSMRVMD